MANEQNPLMTGSAGLVLSAAHLAKQIEWGQITIDQGKAVVQHALGIMNPTQRSEVEVVLRAVVPGLF